ncbi:hypothetical protein PAMA_003603 [Pampus argenteus]
MGWWMFLLLHFHLGNDPWIEVVCVSLPAPSNVSISSFNMEHTLSFLPGLETPSDTHFTVQVLRLRKNTWRPEAACLELTAGQTCNLTRAFKDPFAYYQARVQAFTPTQRSTWAISEVFQPQSDKSMKAAEPASRLSVCAPKLHVSPNPAHYFKCRWDLTSALYKDVTKLPPLLLVEGAVMGPPDVSVSGCGNCLLLHVSVPKTKRLQQYEHLKSLYRELHIHVQRTRDGSQFKLSLPYKEENMITYLQPGVEYCVTVSAKILFNSNSVASQPSCAFTSPPSTRSLQHVIFGLLGAFCVLGLILIGSVIYGAHLSNKLQRLPRNLVKDQALCAAT